MKQNSIAAVEMYERAADYVRNAGLGNEVEWQRQVTLDAFTETDLLREAAWVILCSGFREATVRRSFDHISLCFCDWESAVAILESYPACKNAARAVFRNEGKLEAIVTVAKTVDKIGFAELKRAIVTDPVGQLRRLPYIGAITVWHLAKNLGMNAAKPDRHMERISEQLGFAGAQSLCSAIAKVVGEEVKVVDLVVWRYLADNVGVRQQWT